ncbi:unnamed protein product, partial [Tetraodon nigroviridis]
ENPYLCSDECDASNPDLAHPPQLMQDRERNGLITYWQTVTWRRHPEPLLANITMTWNKSLELTGDVQITFEYGRPTIMILDKSMDHGRSWQPYQFYADDCTDAFNMPPKHVRDLTPANITRVFCTEQYSRWVGSKNEKSVRFEVEARFAVFAGSRLQNMDNLYTRMESMKGLRDFFTFTNTSVEASQARPRGHLRPERQSAQVLLRHLQHRGYQPGEVLLFAAVFIKTHSEADGTLQCQCEHNTTGQDCQRCRKGFKAKSWKAGSYLPTPNGTPNSCTYPECGCSIACTIAGSPSGSKDHRDSLVPEEFTHSETVHQHSHQSHTPHHSVVDRHEPITDESSHVGHHTNLMETEERHSELRKHKEASGNLGEHESDTHGHKSSHKHSRMQEEEHEVSHKSEEHRHETHGHKTSSQHEEKAEQREREVNHHLGGDPHHGHGHKTGPEGQNHEHRDSHHTGEHARETHGRKTVSESGEKREEEEKAEAKVRGTFMSIMATKQPAPPAMRKKERKRRGVEKEQLNQEFITSLREKEGIMKLQNTVMANMRKRLKGTKKKTNSTVSDALDDSHTDSFIPQGLLKLLISGEPQARELFGIIYDDFQDCECYGHSNRCSYIDYLNIVTCVSCKHNTRGQNCQHCRLGYYRNTSAELDDESICIECNCNQMGSVHDRCNGTGFCQCREGATGAKCDDCVPGGYCAKHSRCEAGKDCNAASSLHPATLLICTLLAHMLAMLTPH